MIVVDIETSGTDPSKHSILSIGAVDFYNHDRLFYEECKLEEGKTFTTEALNINGFDEKTLKSDKKKKLEEVLKDFMSWLEQINDITIGGHNVNFDAGFLNYSFKKYGINLSFGHRVVDTHTLVYASLLSRNAEIPLKNKKTDINSDYVFGYVGLPSEPKPHNALTGAKMEAEALSRIIYKKPLFQEYSQYSIPYYLR